MSDLGLVLRALPTLTREELQQVRTRISAVGSLTGSASIIPQPSAANTSGDDYILTGITGELRRRGLLKPTSRVAPTLLTKDYHAASSDVRAFLEDNIKLSRAVDFAALGKLCGRELAAYLERGRVPVLPRTLVLNVQKIPEALDASFPGYLEAGLLARFCWGR